MGASANLFFKGLE